DHLGSRRSAGIVPGRRQAVHRGAVGLGCRPGKDAGADEPALPGQVSRGAAGRCNLRVRREVKAEIMKLSTLTGVVLVVGVAGLVFAQSLKGPVNDAPFTEKWWPSKWGADDKAGSANHTKNSANIRR